MFVSTLSEGAMMRQELDTVKNATAWSFALPPQFCEAQTSAQKLAGELGLSERQADALLNWRRERGVNHSEIRSPAIDREVNLAASVLLDWQVHESQHLVPIRLKEAKSANELDAHLRMRIFGKSASEFAAQKSGSSLRRRFDAAVDKLASKDAAVHLDRCMSQLSQLVSKHSLDQLSPNARWTETNNVTLPLPRGDIEYFASVGGKAEYSAMRYQTLWGPFLPEQIWVLLNGTLEYLQERETEFRSSSVKSQIFSAADAERRYSDALNESFLNQAVRHTAEIAWQIIAFDAEFWLRKERTGLHADLSVNLLEVDEEKFCNLIAEIVVGSIQNEEHNNEHRN